MIHRETDIGHFIVRVPARIETALESRKQMEDIERQADLLKVNGQIWSFVVIFMFMTHGT